jgi:hypothetical protein
MTTFRYLNLSTQCLKTFSIIRRRKNKFICSTHFVIDKVFKGMPTFLQLKARRLREVGNEFD